MASKTIDASTLEDIFREIREQPPYRSQADKEMDYCDGNQLDTETLQLQRAKGIPSVIENLLGPVFEDMAGMERKMRTDWRVDADADEDDEGEVIAKAISYRLCQAEKRSGCEQAITDVYQPLAKVGHGWIEVSRNSDPFGFPYKVQHIHRNEMWKDWYGTQSDLSDHRWLLRRRWVGTDYAMSAFPKQKELITAIGSGWGSWGNMDELSAISSDSGSSTGLSQAWDIQRGFSVEEQNWMDPNGKRVCLFQLLTRTMEQANILKMKNGRVVEFNLNDPMHVMAVVNGFKVEKANISRIRKTIFLGPHVLKSEQSEFSRFNFVQFLSRTEDRTGIPYGNARWLMSLQDEVNARISKMIWRLAATRTIRTKGAVLMTDSAFRQMSGRLDADIILDPKEMAKPGARFEIDSNFDLNEQQYKRLQDLRQTIAHIASVSSAFSGDANPDNSSALSQAIEQSAQGQTRTNDAHAFGRLQVGELLLELIIKDIGKEEQKVVVKGNALKEKEIITLNTPAIDEETGHQYLTNDVQRTMLRVALDDVPSSTHYKHQQLVAMTEFGKSLDPKYQAVLAPYLADLANLPHKDEVVKDIQDITNNTLLSEDQVAKRIKEAVEQEKTQWMVEQKTRELDIKQKESEAKVEQINVKNSLDRIETSFSALNSAILAIQYAQAAPVADQFLKSAGAQDQDTPPILATPPQMQQSSMPVEPVVAPQQNTSPMFPPRIQEPDLQQPDMPQPETIEGSGVGMEQGIEQPGGQI